MPSAPKYQLAGLVRAGNIARNAASGVGSAIRSGIRTITPTNFSLNPTTFVYPFSSGIGQYLRPVGMGEDLMKGAKRGSDLYNFLTKVQNERKLYENLAARNEEIVPNIFSEAGFPKETAYLTDLGFINANKPLYASTIDRYTGIGNLVMNRAFDDGKFPGGRGLISFKPKDLGDAKQQANNLDEFISSGIGGKTTRPIALYRKSSDEYKRVLNTKDNSITIKKLSDLNPGDIILETNFVSYFDINRPLFGMSTYLPPYERSSFLQETAFPSGVSFGVPTFHSNDLSFLEEAESIGNRFGLRKFTGRNPAGTLNFDYMGGFKDGGTAPKHQLAGLVRAGRTGRNLARSGANVLKGFTPVIDFAATTFGGAPTGMFTNMGRFADVIRPNYTAPTRDQVIKLNPAANSLTKFSSIGGLFSKPATRHSYLPFTRKGRANILKRYYDAIGYRPPYMGFREDFVARDYPTPGFLAEGAGISPSTVFETYRNPTTFASVAKALPRTADFFVKSSNPKNPILFGSDGTASRQQVLRGNSFLINQGVVNKPFVFLHGTGSSALPSISRFGGLVPTGQLIERGGAPFAGSLQVLRDWNTAHADHQNRKHISLGMIDSPTTPLNYAFKRPLTNNFREKYNEFLRGESQYSTRNDSRYEGAPIKEIFERRIANFENAPLAEQKLILDNFPVVFGLNPISNSMGTARYRLGKGRYDLAPSLAGGATFDEMAAAFVPRNRIDVTRQYLPGVDVMPLEQFLINMPLMQKYAYGTKLDNKYFNELQKSRSWLLYNLEKDRLSTPQGRYNPDFRQNGGTATKYQGLVGGALRAGRAGKQLSLFPKVVKPLVNPITTTQNLGKQLSFNFNAPSVAVQTYNQPLTFNAPNLTDIPGARDLSFLMEAPAGSDFGKFRQKLYDFRTSNFKPLGDPEYLNFMVNKQPNSLGRYSDYDIPREFNYLTGLGLRDYNTRAGQVALEDYATRRSKLYNTIFSDFKYSPDDATMYMKSPEDFRRRLDMTDPRYQDVLQQLRERVNALDLSFDPNVVGKTSSPLILHRGTRGDMVNVVDPSDFSIKLKRLSEVGDDEIFFSTGFTSTFDPAMPTFFPPIVQKAFGKNDHLRIYNPSGSTVLSPALHMTDIQYPGEGEILLPRFSFFQKAKSFPLKASNLERSNEISGGAFDFNPPTTDLINLGFIRKEGGEITKHQQTTTPNFVSLRDTPKAASGNRRRRLKSNINPFAV